MPSILVTDSQTLLPAGLATALLADGTPQCETFELNGSWCPGVIKATLNQLPQPNPGCHSIRQGCRVSLCRLHAHNSDIHCPQYCTKRILLETTTGFRQCVQCELASLSQNSWHPLYKLLIFPSESLSPFSAVFSLILTSGRIYIVGIESEQDSIPLPRRAKSVNISNKNN